LLRQYGPIVLLPNIIPVDASISETTKPRNSYDECVKYIADELDLAAKDLPTVTQNVIDYGRVDKRAQWQSKLVYCCMLQVLCLMEITKIMPASKYGWQSLDY
jgi:hypothetical protein